ncbi:MAG: hypothetical protein ACREUU_02250, partial [Gammaproteobacteria bacterium]
MPLGIDSPAIITLNTTTVERPSLPLHLRAAPPAEARALALDFPGTLQRELPTPGIAAGRRRSVLRRALEIAPALVALTVITSLIWGPLLARVPFAIAILAFQSYWLWRAQMNGIHAFKGFLLLRRHRKTDWRAVYKQQRVPGKQCL